MTDIEMINAILIMAVIASAVFAVVALVSVARYERHDRVLSPFYDIRRNLMDIVLAERGKFSSEEDAAARFLLSMVNGVIRHYHPHKTFLFNFRALRRAIEKDLRRYRKSQEVIRSRLADLPEDSEVGKAYFHFAVATAGAFVANTPFIRSEIILRLMWGGILRLVWRDLAEQVKTTRHDSQQVIRGDMRLA